MRAKVTKGEQALLLMRERGVVRPRELGEQGIGREQLRRLRAQGLIVENGRGLYSLPDAPVTQHHSLSLVARWVPAGVVCLLSALRFHDLTTQEPHEVWLALPHGAHQPVLRYPPLRTVRMNTLSLEAGREEQEVEGVSVTIFCPAKTVVDCFKYRNLVGLDVALEALREGWRERRFAMDDLWRYARLCRVANVMRPYVEAMVAS